MKKQTNIRNLSFAAMFLALAFVLPFFTGQIPRIGAMLCPMHIPVILCGFVCGGPWGFIVGFTAPLLRSMILGMPVIFPNAFSMAFELSVYGLLSGVLYDRLPKRKLHIYTSLIISMTVGRLVWGLVQFFCMGLDSTKFGFSAFIAGAFTNALPGIAVQLILIPILVMAFENAGILTRRDLK